jgi:chemosensory pili system protein ChpA (sensor histidine kinase/response regulator)
VARAGFDAGPLSWVKHEIDSALQRGAAALSAYGQALAGGAHDAAQLKAAQAHLHQAHGALQIVGLDGVTRITQETEDLLADIDREGARRTPEAIEAAQRGLRDVAAHLEGVVAGKPNQPLRLLPTYAALLVARGAPAPDAADLYFPPLNRRPPPRARSALVLHPEEVRQYLRDQRARYQKGLLAFIKGDRTGTAEMRAAVEAIELLQGLAAQRAFWWVALAFFDALAGGALAGGDEGARGARRLCNRVEQQIRSLSEGSPNVAERLMREALYFVARSSPATEQIRQVQETYQLADTIPVDEADQPAEHAALTAVRELHARAKDGWDHFAAGDAASLAAFCGAANGLRDRAAALGQPALAELARAIAGAGAWLAEDPARASEAFALEQATALLLAGSALADPQSLGAEFDEQAAVVCSRLTECMEGRLLRTAIDIPLLDEMSKRAQEELIAEQAISGMRANLGAVERVLDRFFREPSQRGVLADIGEPLSRLDSALELLGEARARAALEQCAEQIRRFSASDFVPSEPGFSKACEEIAGTLSGLGLYFEALSRGPADFDQAMRPVSAAAEQDPEALEREATVEAKLEGEHREAQKLAEAWAKKPTDTWLKHELQKNLAAMQQDAALVADSRLQAAATEALRAIEDVAAQPEAPAVAQALEQIAPAAQPPAPSPAAERVVEAASVEEAVDAELLAVYLEEADEVLGAVRASLDVLRGDAADNESLVVIRRGFHTLKGSGRMVGLMRLGEAAWAVEQTLNLWLQDGRPAQAPLLDFIAAAEAYFADGVERMKTGGSAPDERPLLAQAESVRRGDTPAQPVRPQPQAAEPQALSVARLPEGLVAEAANEGEAFVEVGGQRVSTTLYTIFSGEAHMHLGKLKEEHETLKVHGVITDEMLRAAHTLAGIAGTVQLETLHDFAQALERSLSALSLEPLSGDEETLIEEAIDAVERMVLNALELAEPAPAPELIERLRRVAPSTAAAAPAPVETAPVPEEDDGLPPPGEPISEEDEEEAAAVAELRAPAAAPAPPPVATAAKSGTAAQVEIDDGPPERRQRRIRDELDPQLLPLFMEEAGELVPSIGLSLRSWRDAPADAGRAQALKRLLHTLKGSARMAGAMAIGELTHHMETRIERSSALGAASAKLFEELDTSMERLGILFERVKQPTADVPDDAPQAGVASEAPAPMLRVKTELIDQLVNQSGEVSIARSRIEGEVRTLRSAVQELTDNVARLRGQLRDIEIHAESQMQSRREQTQAAHEQFDPLEIDRFTRFQEVTRMMAESVNDVQTVHQNLVHAMDSTDAALAAQARLNRDLQQDLMRVRMVPLARLAERLHRVVRQGAKELGKRASLDIRGAQVELDRSVLERITAPIEHMLRNSVTHGIETPEVRAAAGKPPIGEIRLDVSQEGNEVVLILADDGAGLDVARVLARARALGLPGASGNPGAAEIADYIFLPGFSTAEQVTELSGRGVGMDVVRNEVASLGGRVELSYEAGRGTRFSIFLPLTLAVTQAVLVKSGARTYAVPTVMVEHVMQMRAGDLEKMRDSATLEWQGRRYPFHPLTTLLGLPRHESAGRPGPALFVRSGANYVAIHVDEILSSSQEIVVKSIGPHIARIPGIAGATVLGSGDIVLILNPVQLAARGAESGTQREAPEPAEVPAAPAPALVMVVDDSLTVRKITGRLLERQGYRVVTARDGVEALELLQELAPAAMLVDIEMPRMDGFDLTRNVRGNPRLAGVPIVMITSRTADKHRDYAREIGVDHYLGKPYQEEELLGVIARLAAEGRAAA